MNNNTELRKNNIAEYRSWVRGFYRLERETGRVCFSKVIRWKWGVYGM